MSATETETNPQPPVSVLRFDWTDWLPYLDDQDIPDAQKREFIETLWSIVVSFVDLGWQIDSNPQTGTSLDLKAIMMEAATSYAQEAI